MIELSPLEARVIGALVEKEVTTPDQYPLSLKALTVACNQKSNREPVMNLEEVEVQDVVDGLSKRNLVGEMVFGSRVAKYKHRFCNTEFSKLHLNAKELGILCVLFLRGAQTPGELRSRTNRLCDFSDVTEVEDCLQRLQDKEDGPFVAKLPREPGKRESRYVHLFSGEPEFIEQSEPAQGTASPSTSGGSSLSERVTALEEELASVRAELNELRALWDDLNG